MFWSLSTPYMIFSIILFLHHSLHVVYPGNVNCWFLFSRSWSVCTVLALYVMLRVLGNYNRTPVDKYPTPHVTHPTHYPIIHQCRAELSNYLPSIIQWRRRIHREVVSTLIVAHVCNKCATTYSQQPYHYCVSLCLIVCCFAFLCHYLVHSTCDHR